MAISIHEAVGALRYSDTERLRPRLTAFIDSQLSRVSREREEDEPTASDVGGEAVKLLKELGAPWFAFTSYVLPGWTWGGVPLNPDKKVEVHVRWMTMRIEDFRREVGRLEELFDVERVGIEPELYVRRVCGSELPRIVEEHEQSWEAYDAIQLACDLMLEAARLPINDVVRSTINGFIGSSLPTPDELERFIDELAKAVGDAFCERFGQPPYEGREGELIALEVRIEGTLWELGWLRERVASETYLDEVELDRLKRDLTALERRFDYDLGRLQDLFHDIVEAVEKEVEELEGEWVAANDRDSVITQANSLSRINSQKARLASLYARWEHVSGLDTEGRDR